MLSKVTKFALISLFALGAASPAHAVKLLVEPYAGWSFLAKYADNSSGTEVDTKWNALTLGARAGVDIGPIFIAADGSYLPTINAIDMKLLRVGGVVGLSIPNTPLRIWAGYNFIDKLSSKSSSNSLNGSAFKIGAGWMILKVFSINAEYMLATYKSVTVGGTSTDLATSNKNNSLLISLSLPFSFG